MNSATNEVTTSINFLCSAGPHANTAVSSKVADQIMLTTGGNVLSGGRLHNIVCRKLSPGTCRLTLELANP